MRRKVSLTHKRLLELLAYNPRTGIFTWRVSRRGQRPQAGDVAGGQADSGYWIIGLDGATYGAHRLAWFYMEGEWPPHEVDHRNRKRADNRWRNLRKATPAEQRQNQSIGSANKTGFLGVRLHKSGKYEANIKANGKAKYLGLFDTPEAASRAYRKAKKQLHAFQPTLE